MTHAEQCLVHARKHLRELTERVKNPSTIPALMETYLSQPAYSDVRGWIWEQIMATEGYRRVN
jgi:hypothetical protein